MFFCCTALTSTGWVRTGWVRMTIKPGHCPPFLSSAAVIESKWHQIFLEKNSGTQGIEPGPAGRGARTLPLCYACRPPHSLEMFVDLRDWIRNSYSEDLARCSFYVWALLIIYVALWLWLFSFFLAYYLKVSMNGSYSIYVLSIGKTDLTHLVLTSAMDYSIQDPFWYELIWRLRLI